MNIKSVEVVGCVEACPYCQKERYEKVVCCGEVHFELAFVLVDGSLLFQSEIQEPQAS